MASINLGLGGSPTNRQPGASAAAAASPAAGARGTTERSQQNDVINVKLVYKRGFYWMIFKNEHHKNEALGILRKCDDPNLTVTLACLKNDETLNSRVKNDAPEDQEFVLPLTFSMPGHINNLINVLENDFKLDTESVPPRFFKVFRREVQILHCRESSNKRPKP